MFPMAKEVIYSMNIWNNFILNTVFLNKQFNVWYTNQLLMEFLSHTCAEINLRNESEGKTFKIFCANFVIDCMLPTPHIYGLHDSCPSFLWTECFLSILSMDWMLRVLATHRLNAPQFKDWMLPALPKHRLNAPVTLIRDWMLSSLPIT
jgi:hypothetical protein